MEGSYYQQVMTFFILLLFIYYYYLYINFLIFNFTTRPWHHQARPPAPLNKGVSTASAYTHMQCTQNTLNGTHRIAYKFKYMDVHKCDWVWENWYYRL